MNSATQTFHRPFPAFLPILIPAVLTACVAGDVPQRGTLDLPAPVIDADYYDNGSPAAAKVELGRMLFFDKVLSGNKNIACATCHHPKANTGDGISLSLGEGATGLGPDRDASGGIMGAVDRVPRNAPPLFNIGARSFTRLFHDGRIEALPVGFRNPAKFELPQGLDNALAVQALFPMTSDTEMAGHAGESPVGQAAAVKIEPHRLVWGLLESRLKQNAGYQRLFTAAYPGRPITMVNAANAIAAFEAVTWRADNSPFDGYLRGDKKALNSSAKRGLGLFYGEAGCAQCHSGKFQTDMAFHAIAMPQIGPGAGDGVEGRLDLGRERVTTKVADRYKFRTPSLRNVAATGPWGHSGAYGSLEAVVRHHLDPVKSLMSYDPEQAHLPSRGDLNALDFEVMEDKRALESIAKANELALIHLADDEVADMLAFLNALTDPESLKVYGIVPDRVPSGLPVSDELFVNK